MIKILISGEGSSILNLYQRILSHLDYSYDVVTNPVEILTALRTQTYHVWIIDLSSDNKRSLDFLIQAKAREVKNQIKIIAVVNSHLSNQEKMELNHWSYQILQKPFGVKEFEAALNQCLSKKS